MDSKELDDDFWGSEDHYYIDLVKQNAKMRDILIKRLRPIEDPSKAWVILSVHEHTSQQYLERAPHLIADMKYLLAGKSQDEAFEIEKQAFDKLLEDTGGRIVEKIQQAAFSNFELADQFSRYLNPCEGPIHMPLMEIVVEIDQFREEILDGKRPFEVLMMDGEIFEVWGYGSPDEMDIIGINPVSYTVEESRVCLSGTFWALDQFIACDMGISMWKEYATMGKFRFK